MRFARERKTALAVTTVLFASLLTVAVPASASTVSPSAETVTVPASVEGAVALDFGPTTAAPAARTSAPANAAATGTVSGTVTATGAADVSFVRLLVPDQKTGYSRWKTSSFYTWTDEAGAYSIAGVTPGTYTAVFVSLDETFSASYYGSASNITTAKAFVVAANGTVTGINGTVLPGVAVSGTITTSAGTGLENAYVQVARQITVDGKPFWEYDYDFTAADGTYAVSAMNAGTLAVRASGPSGAGYTPAFYGGGTAFESSKTFALNSGQSRTGVNVTLTRAIKVGTPTISGTAAVGSKLAAKTGSWSSGVAFSYQWYANGKAISKATKSTFTLTKSQKAKKITVTVTGKKSGYATGFKTSKATAKVATAATPKITGTAKVGKKLTVVRGTWTSGTTFSYRWYANGKAISKATKSTFTLTKAQKGKTITVKVTGKKSGYATVTKASKATKKVS